MARRPDDALRKTPAQWFGYVAGGLLLLVGLLGFAASTSFASSPVTTDTLFFFAVNGWSNLLHVVSGLLLLAAANTRPTAKAVALPFGVLYVFFALWGFIDGNSIFGLFGVDGVASLIHLVLGALGIAAGIVSPTTKGQQRRRRERRGTPALPPDRDEAERLDGGVDRDPADVPGRDPAR